MRIIVDAPATLSNLGPGFDVLGMAVQISNRFEFEFVDDRTRFEAYGVPTKPSRHLALRTMVDAAAHFGAALPGGVVVVQEESVPRARGLGSSATARVAGLVAWAKATGSKLPIERAAAFLADAEGHPDNVVPALVGGLVVCAMDGDALVYRRFDAPAMKVALCIPDRRVETAAAREVLPADYPRADVVFSTSRIALLLAGLLTGDGDALRIGCRDKIHHPYRRDLIGPVDDAIEGALGAGADGAFISGSGSTLAAFVLDGDADAVASALAAPFADAGIRCATRVTAPRGSGAWDLDDASGDGGEPTEKSQGR